MLSRVKGARLSLGNAIDKISDILIITDLNATIIKINTATAGLLGNSAAEIKGKSIASIIPEKTIDDIRAMSKGEQRPDDYNINFRCADGGIIPVIVTYTAVKDIRNKTVYFAIIGKNSYNSEEMRIETLRRSQAEEKERLFSQKVLSLCKASMSLADLSPGEDLYGFLAQKIRELAGDCLVFIHSYNDANHESLIRAFSGSPENIVRFNKILGASPVGIFVKMEKAKTALYEGGRLAVMPLSLYEMWSGALSEDLCFELEKSANLTGRYGLGLIKKGEFLGNAEILMSGNAVPENNLIIETLARMWVLALSIREMENHERFYSAGFQNIRKNIKGLLEAGSRPEKKRVVLESLLVLDPDCLVFIISRTAGETMSIETISGQDKYIKTLQQLLKKDLKGMEIKIPDELRKPSGHELKTVRGGLYEITSGAVSLKDSDLVERKMDLGYFYAVPLGKEEDINNMIAVMKRAPLDGDSHCMIEIFACCASFFI
jgi:PAS domain S-box-containing protein